MLQLLTSILISAFLFSSANAQDPHGDFAMPAQDLKPDYQQRGQLLTIKIIPAGKETRLYVVGNETASLKFDKINVTGKMKFGQNEKVIQFNREKDYFTTTEELHGEMNLNLEMKDKKKSEHFKIQMSNP